MAKRVVMCSIALLVAGLGFADPGPDSVELTRTATILGPASSPPDHLLAAVTVTVAAGVNVAGSLTAFAIQENIPSGWTYISVDSTPAPAVDGPDPNNPEILNFVWVELPNLSSPFTMTYTLAIPASSTGGSITGQVLYRTSGGPLTSVPVTTQQDFFNCLLMTRTAPANYRAGDQVTVTVSVTSFCGTSSTQPLTAMGIEETIPATWSLVSVSGNSGDIQPAPGATGTLSFGWTTSPAAFPITFSYVLNVPQDASGNAQIDGVILSRLGPSEELTSPREVTSIAYIPTALVPNVTGQTETDARAAIEAVGLTVGTVTRQCNNTQPENTVLEQSPTSGTRLDLGEPVDLVVSNGPCQVTVPDVVGQTLSSAISTLLSAGFQIGTATQQCHATYPGETIIGQDPPGDSTALYGSAVNLVLSSGPCQVAVPNVTGQTQSAAAAAITDAGLTVGTVTQQCSDTVPAGSVISQDPVAGTQITSGSAVDLVVSNGPCQSVVSVPDVMGQTESAATAAITGAGLTVGSITTQCSDTAPAGSVISQVPAAGTQVQPGATVDLVISTGACNAIVPDVVGLSLEAAQAALSVYSFTVNTTDACSDTVPAGNVISQNPVAGTLVSSGISVNLVVSSGKPIVPDVTGLL